MPDASAKPQCLIIAESDVLVRSVLAEYLRGCGYKVIEAAHCDEVVTLFEHGAHPIDAVLLETELAGTKNAFDLRIWLRRHHPDVHVVMAGTIDTAARAAGALCDEGPHLARPYHPQAVLDHLKRLLASARR